MSLAKAADGAKLCSVRVSATKTNIYIISKFNVDTVVDPDTAFHIKKPLVCSPSRGSICVNNVYMN